MPRARETTLIFVVKYLSPLTFDLYLSVNLFEKKIFNDAARRLSCPCLNMKI